MAIVTRIDGESDSDFLGRAAATNGYTTPIVGDPLRLPILYVPRTEAGQGGKPAWVERQGLRVVRGGVRRWDALLAVVAWEGQHPDEFGTAEFLVEGAEGRATTPCATLRHSEGERDG